MSITDRVAYIRGMVEGIELNVNTPEGKLLIQIIEALGETAAQLTDLQEGYEDLCEYVESVDEDLEALEMEFHGESEESFDDDDDETLDNILLDDFDDEDEDDEDDDEDEDEIFGEEFDSDDYGALICCVCPECKQVFGINSEDEESEDLDEDDEDLDDEDLDAVIHNEYLCPHCQKGVTPIPLDFSKLAVAPLVRTDDK